MWYNKYGDDMKKRKLNKNGIKFEKPCIINSVRELNVDGIKHPIIEDVTEWLNEKQI